MTGNVMSCNAFAHTKIAGMIRCAAGHKAADQTDEGLTSKPWNCMGIQWEERTQTEPGSWCEYFRRTYNLWKTEMFAKMLRLGNDVFLSAAAMALGCFQQKLMVPRKEHVLLQTITTRPYFYHRYTTDTSPHVTGLSILADSRQQFSR